MRVHSRLFSRFPAHSSLNHSLPCAAVLLILTISAAAQGVNVSSPGNGATVSSPVQFVASAAAVNGRVIDAMRIYVDSNSDYTVAASNLKTSLALSNGVHNLSIQAWDNTGA